MASSSSRAIRWKTAGELKKDAVVTTEVLEVKETGLEVKIVDTELTSFIKRYELARDRNDQRSDRFQVGQKVDARVTQFDRKVEQGQLSIKALEVAEEKEAIAQYGSSDSGATLGDILGTALKRKGRGRPTPRRRRADAVCPQSHQVRAGRSDPACVCFGRRDPSDVHFLTQCRCTRLRTAGTG